jgi:hypothetical protein
MKCGTSIALFIQVNETGPSNNSLIGTSAPMCFMRTLICTIPGRQAQPRIDLTRMRQSVMFLDVCTERTDPHRTPPKGG